jgi:hypothetical protein
MTPAQQEVLEQLGATGDQRPRFDAGLRTELRTRLEEGLAPIVATLPAEEDLYLDKYRLAQVHGCEARFLAEEARAFAWSVPLARGTVVHKAVELTLNWRGETVPAHLVDEALAKLEADGAPVSEFLRACSEAEHAELRAEAVDLLSKFLECFPPLSARWAPVVESRIRAELLDRRVALVGRVDLTLGRQTGTTAGKVVIDLKSGGFSPTHVDDLRFYGLIETLRTGVPPRLLASYYLDTCRAHPEAVSEAVLESTAERVVAGAERLVDLRHDPHRATKRVGTPCRWCPINHHCAEGRAWLEDRRDDGSVWGSEFEFD